MEKETPQQAMDAKSQSLVESLHEDAQREAEGIAAEAVRLRDERLDDEEDDQGENERLDDLEEAPEEAVA